jgi:hypothetical protein
MEPLLNGKKPVLFIMTEDTKSCDAVENYIRRIQVTSVAGGGG